MSTSSSSSDPSQATAGQGAGASLDDEAIQRAKFEIQSLVQEVVQLSKSEIEPNEFFSATMDKTVSALAAVSGVVWMLEEGGPLKLEYQVNLRETGLAQSEEAQVQHGRLLTQVIGKAEPTIIPPYSGGDAENEEAAANPTEYLLVLAPIVSDRGVEGVMEVFQRTGGRPTTQRGYLRFLVQISDLAGEYLKNRRLLHFATKQTLWEQLEAFTTLVHKALDSRETAYTIANEGRRLIGCDRVTVVLRKGSKYEVSAISGQDTFDKRSNVVRLLKNLATTVSRTGEDLWFTGDTADLAPQVEKAVNAYVDESHTKQLAVLPLRESDKDLEETPEDKKDKRRENILGAIVIEQLVDSRPPEGMLQRIDVVRRHSATSLTNAQDFEGLFLLPLWRALGKTKVLLTARNLPKTLLAAIAIAGAIFALCTVPYDFTMVADGKLLPEVRRNVFAGIDGLVTKVPVNHGESVKKGDVLAVMQSLDLDGQFAELQGELASTLEEIATTDRQRQMHLNNPQEDPADMEQLTGRLAQLEATRISLEKQYELLEQKKERLTVESPIDGKVTTFRVREKLENRRVSPGNRLMEVADPSQDWELEIYLPEAKMGHVIEYQQKLREKDPDAKLQVSFILATHSAEHLTGTVEEIDTSAEVMGEEGNTVRIRVSFPQEDLKRLVDDPANQLKVGADAKAKILCGKQPVGYVMLHDLFEFVQSRILFRL
ncbi:efflux RND transporter periplasmic adaptor subunit [Bythopirellula goksoeyrii]|uniref:HlyD family secretion protein n=1 Tax=Bythopirellula goksoeyrii TaxID=1400387 RepID=A0A5B9QEU9_9BACT|nr:efflux RND transporter periplasmic adaptor subunit [Bythopirellula goksoeyrii]QEG37484.1 HlyD family secretion protein [Bythopirellula goksoeyrii]